MTQEVNNNYNDVKSQNKKRLLQIFGLIIFNSILFVIVGAYMSTQEKIKVVLISNFISIPFFAFIIGLLGSLVPYKKLTYIQKIIRTTLLIIFAFQVLFAIGAICLALMRIFGMYPPK